MTSPGSDEANWPLRGVPPPDRSARLADLGGTDGPTAALLGVSDIPGARSLELVLVPASASQEAPPTVVVGERRE